MEFDVPHDTPRPTDPDALLADHDITFRDNAGDRVILHRPQYVGTVAEYDARALWDARYVAYEPTHYAIVRINRRDDGVVATGVKGNADEPTPIHDALAKARAR